MALLLALITYIGWGSGDIFGVFAVRKIGPYLTSVFVFIFGFIIASLYIPFAAADFHKITFPLLLLNILFGVFILIGNFLLNEAFKRSNASVIGVIVQSFPAIVLILSAIIFHDPITYIQILWIVLIFTGMFLCTINIADFRKGKKIIDSGIIFALIGAVFFSIYFTYSRLFVNVYGWFWPNYISIASFPIAIFLIQRLFKIKDKIKIPKEKSVIGTIILAALLLRGGDIALNYGISSGFASIVTPIASASPTLFVTLAYFVFKDKITTQQKIGIGICLLGIVLLGIFSR